MRSGREMTQFPQQMDAAVEKLEGPKSESRRSETASRGRDGGVG